MSKIERTVILYHMGLTLYTGRNVPNNYCLFDELTTILDYINTLPEVDRKINYKKEDKVLYLKNPTKGKSNSNFNLEFTSAKYNQVREVIDTITLASRGTLKNKTDGDKEKNHVSISFQDENNAICAFEYNYYGIGMSRIISYLNDMANRLYMEKGETKFYRIDVELIPDEDFLTTLEKMDRISVATFIVDKEDLNTSDFKDLAKREDIRQEVEVVVKPKGKGASIMKKTIKEYFEKKSKDQRILRILAQGRGESGKIYLDTEQMKTKHTLSVEVDSLGVVIPNMMFEQLESVLPSNYLNGED